MFDEHEVIEYLQSDYTYWKLIENAEERNLESGWITINRIEIAGNDYLLKLARIMI